MDPSATLRKFRESRACMDIESAAEAASDLLGWLARGGYRPGEFGDGGIFPVLHWFADRLPD